MSTELRARARVGAIAIAVVGALTVNPHSLAAQSSPSITATPGTVGPGAPITVTVANGPGNPNDWVGLVATGDPDTSYVAWQFLNGATSVPATGLTNATLQFVAPSTPGPYTARLFANGWTRLATSSPVTVQTQTLTSTVTATPTTVNPSAPITVTVANGPGLQNDWVALAATGAPDTSYVAWEFLSGTTSLPPAGLTSATLPFAAPTMPGTYVARLFTNGWTKLATSSPITVQTQPTLTLNNVTVTEGSSGTTPATFTVTVSPTSTNTVTVNYATANGTALAGSDYVAASGTLTFAPGTATRPVTVLVNGHTTPGPNTTFVVTLSSPTNAVLGGGAGVGTIVNANVPPPPTVAGPATVAPGAAFTVTVANGPGLQNDWVALAATGAPDTSYVAWAYLSGTTSFPPTGLTSATLPFVAPMVPGTYVARLFTNGWTKLATSSPITVQTQPTLTLNNVTVTEGSSGTTPATFTVTVSPTSTNTVTVNYATANGTAMAGSDYVAASGTLTFAPGTATRPVTVLVNGHTTPGPNTTFAVMLSSPTNAVLGGGAGVGTIVNANVPPPPTVAGPATVAPGAAFTVTVANGPGLQNDWVALAATGAPDTSYVAWAYLSGTTSLPPTGLTSATLPFVAPMTPGTFILRLFTNGWTKLATSSAVTVGDTTPPTVSLTAPAANATVAGAVTVSATASDNVGVAGVQFRLDGAPLGAEVLAAPYSIAWNTLGSAGADLVFGVTKVATGPPTMTAGTGLTSRLGVSCPGCTGADMVSEDKLQTSAGPTAATWTFSIPAHYQAQMAAFKAAGTPAFIQGATATSNSSGATIAQAFGAPVTAGNLLVVAVAWQGTSAIGVTDNRANVYAVATSAFDAVNGQTLAILYAANAASGATTVTASFSGTAPTVQRLELHEYSGIAATNPLDVMATNSADGTTAANTITSGSATTTGASPVSNGSHTLTAQARDAAGNITTSAAVTVTVSNAADITPPVISGVAAVAITSSGATIDWTTNEASDSQVDYGTTTTYGSTSPLIGTLVTTHAMILGGLTGGTTYHVRARSKDAAGNLGLSGDTPFTTLTVDVTPPVVSITAPAANATVSGTTTFSATATDNTGGSGMAGVEFKLDGVNLAPEDTVAPYTVAWDTTTASAGVHTLTAVAWDVAGNQATATRTVTVANATAQVQLAWDPDADSVAGYRVKVGTSSGVYSIANVDAGNVTAFTVTGLVPGNVYYFAVTAYYASGAESGFSNEVSAAK